MKVILYSRLGVLAGMLPTGLSSMGSHYSWVVPFYVGGSASTVGLVKFDVRDHSDLDRHCLLHLSYTFIFDHN